MRRFAIAALAAASCLSAPCLPVRAGEAGKPVPPSKPAECAPGLADFEDAFGLNDFAGAQKIAEQKAAAETSPAFKAQLLAAAAVARVVTDRDKAFAASVRALKGKQHTFWTSSGGEKSGIVGDVGEGLFELTSGTLSMQIGWWDLTGRSVEELAPGWDQGQQGTAFRAFKALAATDTKKVRELAGEAADHPLAGYLAMRAKRIDDIQGGAADAAAGAPAAPAGPNYATTPGSLVACFVGGIQIGSPVPDHGAPAFSIDPARGVALLSDDAVVIRPWFDLRDNSGQPLRMSITVAEGKGRKAGDPVRLQVIVLARERAAGTAPADGPWCWFWQLNNDARWINGCYTGKGKKNGSGGALDGGSVSIGDTVDVAVKPPAQSEKSWGVIARIRGKDTLLAADDGTPPDRVRLGVAIGRGLTLSAIRVSKAPSAKQEP
jgi:hypothetical protein